MRWCNTLEFRKQLVNERRLSSNLPRLSNGGDEAHCRRALCWRDVFWVAGGDRARRTESFLLPPEGSLFFKKEALAWLHFTATAPLRDTAGMTLAARLDACLKAIPANFPGPGGAVAVVREGEVLVRHAWGFANAERRIAFTPNTLFRMCSITKQFTCAAMLSLFPDPGVLDGDVRARLPRLEAPAPAALHLAHNQSGLRDYWAVAMLHGSPVEAPFGDAEAERVIAGTRTLQFAPGSAYSYVNQNFRLLSDILQARTGNSFAALLRACVFEPAGMEGAILAADTTAMPDGTEGYEGNPETGFRAAVNRVLWTGDAGLGASLDDMIAWERFIDRTRDDPQSLYQRLVAPVAFADGAPAEYGFGLSRRAVCGRAATGHGGALRGWRSQRLYIASERLSVVVMFNHLSDANAAAAQLVAAVLGEAAPDIAGRYHCEELDSELTIADAGGVLYGAFSGFLGQGRMDVLTPLAADLWTLPCPRALDHTPPGDWTLHISRDSAGRAVGVQVGCWLARRLAYHVC